MSILSHRPTKCTYLYPVFNTMDEDNPSNNTRTLKEASAYVVLFSGFKREESIRQVMGWKRYAGFVEISSLTKKSYFLPMTPTASEHKDPNPDNSFMICSNVMLAILGKGKQFCCTCCKAYKSNNVPMYGLKGKVSINILDPDLDIYLSLCWFFDEMQELAKTRASRLVCELTNNGFQDDNDTLDFRLGQQKETCIADGVLSRGGTSGPRTWVAGRRCPEMTIPVSCDCSCIIFFSNSCLICTFHLASRHTNS
jgi:hypothetical protein